MDKQFELKSIIFETCIFAILTMFLMIPTGSIWLAFLVSYLIFLTLQLVTYFKSPAQDPKNFSNSMIMNYLNTYRILKSSLILAGVWTVSSFVIFILIPENPNRFAVFFVVSNLFFDIFFVPNFIYYLCLYASKKKIISELYSQRIDFIIKNKNSSLENCDYKDHISTLEIYEKTPIQSIKKIAGGESDLTNELKNYADLINAKLLPMHAKKITKTVEIFNYIDKKIDQINRENRLNIVIQQQKLINNLKENVDQYLSVPADQRHQYYYQLNAVPNLLLQQNLEYSVNSLIETIDILYQSDLQTFIEHQNSIDKARSSQVSDFQIESHQDKH